jgi:ketosteroid isomerase-like protein
MLPGSRPLRVLVVETSPAMGTAIAAALEAEGLEVELATTFVAATEAIERRVFDVVLSVPLRGGPGEGAFDRVAELRRRAAPTPFGLMTGQELGMHDTAPRNFAFFLPKPFATEALLISLARASGTRLPDDRPESALVRRYFAALNASDGEALAQLCTPDVVYYLPVPGPLGRMLVGRPALREHMVEVFRHFPDAHFDELAIYDLGHGLVTRYRGRWRSPDGKRHEQAGTLILRVETGRISRIGVEIDHERLLKTMPTG